MERFKITIALVLSLVSATVFCPDVALSACSVNDDCPFTSWIQYCEKTDGDCNGLGECTTRPDFCTQNYDPVCGCDGKTYSNRCNAAVRGVNVNYPGACRLLGDLLADTNFNGNQTSADLLADSPGQDWYESRADTPGGPGLLTLDEGNNTSNSTRKARLQADYDHNAYLTQEFSSPQSGTFTVRWNVYVDEIKKSDLERGAMMIIGDNSADGASSDAGKGPNSTSSEFYAFMAFWSPGGGGNTAGDTMRLIAMEPENSYGKSSEWRPVATNLTFDRWHTITVVCDVLRDTYDVYVNGVLEAENVKSFTGKDKVTHISFAQFNDAPATFYVDNVVTPTGDETKLLALDAANTDWFGDSVAISGNVALVGAPRGDKKIGDNAGAVYVYNYNGSAWVQQQKLSASDGASSDYFGSSIAISGNVALVGAYRDDDQGSLSGSAYVFRLKSGRWVQEKKLLAKDGAASDYFGASVAISGNVALVGAYGDDDTGPESGSAYVFRWTSGEWVPENKLLAKDGAASDYFGASVAISGDVALVGAWRGDQEKDDNAGVAYVYHYVDSEWEQKPKLRASDWQENDRFGSSVSITDSDNDGNGDLAIIGAPNNDDDGNQTGSAYIFRYKDGEWVEENKLLASMGDEYTYFGSAVAISGDVVVIGKSGPVEGWFPSREAHVYCFDDSGWVEQRGLIATDGHIRDYFGSALAISGDEALVGAPFNDEKGDNAGAAYVFTGLCCTDNDNDGFSAEGETCGPVDCNDNDQTIHPGAPELCDGKDNDCDGTSDEGLASQPTSCGVGECAAVGTMSCVGGQWEDNCRTGSPSTEICDGKDNDCDGNSDEGLGSQPTSCGVGECAAVGTNSCVGGQWEDNCQTGSPSTEICDGKDNDCDRAVDEDFADLGGACTVGRGECKAVGTYICSADGQGRQCDATPGSPETELCDGKDNDCDGAVDEDVCDSDNDGILDGDEDVNNNGAVNPGETDPVAADTDGDGIPDGTELGLTLSDIGPATDINIFQPDMDPTTKTDPLDDDSDNDRLLDGQEDANHNGRIDPCETDPTLPDELRVVINRVVAPSYPTMVSFVKVTDSELGNPIDNLVDSNFSVSEDGVLQSPITVRPPGIYEPIVVALCLDYSNSMEINEKKPLMENAAKSFIKQLGPDDAAEIIIFATEVEVAQTFTTDKNALADAISGTADGQTALYDAIYQAVSDTAAQPGKQAVIAMTDGKDNESTHSLEATINHAASSGVPVYTIGLGSAEAALLEQIANETGGQYHYAPVSSDLEAIYQVVAEVLLNQYGVSYTTKLKGRRRHMLDVRVSSAGLTGSDCQEFVMDRQIAMPWILLLLLEE